MLDLLKSLWPVLPSIALMAAIFKWRDERRKRAAGSLLTVTDAVDVRRVRWAKCSLKSWTETYARVTGIRVLLPLSAAGFTWQDENETGSQERHQRTYRTPLSQRKISIRNNLHIAPNESKVVTVMIDPGPRLLRSKKKSRLLLYVSVETLDAQRRRSSMLLWSNPVDWSKPPQD